MIGVTVRWVDSFEPLRELDVADSVTTTIHHEAHALAEGEGVVYVVVAVEVEDEGAIGEDCRGTNQGIHCTCLLVVVVARSLLTGDISKHGEANVDVCEVEGLLVWPPINRFALWHLDHHLLMGSISTLIHMHYIVSSHH